MLWAGDVIGSAGVVAVWRYMWRRPCSRLSPWEHSSDDKSYELLWVRVGDTIVGALYHPPRPQYATNALLDYIEACVSELSRYFPAAAIVLAGDFNQLTDSSVLERTGLSQHEVITYSIDCSSPALQPTQQCVSLSLPSAPITKRSWLTTLCQLLQPRPLSPSHTDVLHRHSMVCCYSIFQALILISSMIHKNHSIYLTSSTILHIAFLTSFIPFAPLPLHLETQIL